MALKLLMSVNQLQMHLNLDGDSVTVYTLSVTDMHYDTTNGFSVAPCVALCKGLPFMLFVFVPLLIAVIGLLANYPQSVCNLFSNF